VRWGRTSPGASRVVGPVRPPPPSVPWSTLGTAIAAWGAIALAAAVACESRPTAIDVPAAIGAPQDPTPSPAADVRAATPTPSYEPAMAEGREAFTKQDYAAAVVAFERALVATPDDPRALSELGWAALHAGDLALAERVLVRATEQGGEPRIAAASFYNLGRVREAQGRMSDAAALYERSLGLRDARTVRARLGQLALAPAKAALDVELLVGPFAELAQWCDDHVHAATPGATPRCDTELPPRRGLVIEQPTFESAAGILEARFVATTDDGDGGALVQHHLAVRTEAGWFVRVDVAAHGNAGPGSGRAELSHLGVEIVEVVPAGGPELMVRVDEAWLETTRGPGGVLHEDRRSDRIFCGVGPSGRPACTSPIPLVGALRELTDRGRGPSRSEQRWRMSLRVAKRKIVITGEPDAVDDAHRAWLGTHAIAFP
jgi:hypothetical protein